MRQNSDDALVEWMLRQELREIFGSADDVLGEMKVKVLFKGVTYELLNDPEFLKVAKERLGKANVLHEEFDAAKAVG